MQLSEFREYLIPRDAEHGHVSSLVRTSRYFSIIASGRRPASCLVNVDVPKTTLWLADFFVVNIAHCFNEIEDNVGDVKVRSIFDRSVLWLVVSRRFMITAGGRTSLEAKDLVLSAGRTRASCCASFMSRNAKQPRES